MQKAFNFKDKDGKMHAGHLETTDEMYRKIIIDEESVPLLIVKGYNYYHATPYNGTIPVLADTWKNIIPLVNEQKRILVLGDNDGVQTLGLLLTYGYNEKSKIFYCNPFTTPDEMSSRDHVKMVKLTTETLRITGMTKKVNVYTEYSRNLLPSLKRAILDIAFVDLNSDPRYLLEDLVLLWRKVKTKGFVILHDYKNPKKQDAIQAFLKCYQEHYNIVGDQHDQLFLLKTEYEKIEEKLTQEEGTTEPIETTTK